MGTQLAPSRRECGAVSRNSLRFNSAEVAELADAQDLGSCDRKAVGVQIPPSAPPLQERSERLVFFVDSAEFLRNGNHKFKQK